MKENNLDNYISLQEAVKYCNYSQEYLSLRARQGKLKAVKFGRNWITKKDWLKDYSEKVEEYNNNFKIGLAKKFVAPAFVKTTAGKPPKNLPIEKLPALRFGFATALVFILITAGITFGQESFKNIFEQTSSLSQGFSENFDRGLAIEIQKSKTELLSIEAKVKKRMEFSSPFKSQKLTKDISYGVSLVGTAGDIVVEGIANSFTESFVNVGYPIRNAISNGASQAADIGELFGEYGQWISRSYFAANDFLEQKISQGYQKTNNYIGDTGDTYAILGNLAVKVVQGYLTANNFAEEKLREFVETIKKVPGNLVRGYTTTNDFVEAKLLNLKEQIVKNYFAANNFVEEKLKQGYQAATTPFVKAYRFVTAPWKIPFLEEIARPEVKKEELETLQKEVKELKEKGFVVKEVTKEVSKITQIEPIKEITKEIRLIDEQSLKLIRADIVDLQSEMVKRLYAPGGVITQQIYIKEPVASPKIYQENSDIVLQAVGTGNVILSAATGMQISGSQVVIDSTSVLNPLVYIADKTRIGGAITVEGSASIGGPITAQSITLNASAGYGKILDVQTGGTTKFSIEDTGAATLIGNFTITGNLTETGVMAISTSSSQTVLTITQSGTGNIIDIKDAGTSVFTIADGGYATFAINASTTPAVIIRAQDTSWTQASSTYFGIAATSTFTGRFIDFEKAGTSMFYVDGAGNIVAVGTMDMGTTTIRGLLTVYGDILPGTTTFYNLGSQAYKWGNLYVSTTTIGGTIIINTNSITATSSLNITSNAASQWQTIGANLTLQTATSGHLYITSASSTQITAGTSLVETFATGSSYTLYQGGTPRIAIDTSGNITFSGTTTIELYATSTTVTGEFRTTATTTLATAGGYVGIATTTPSERLTVVGNIWGSGNIVLTGTTATSSIASPFYTQATTTFGSATSTPIYFTGYVQSNILPYLNIAYDLGASNFKWRNLYVGTTTIGSTITIGSNDITSNGALNITGAAASTWTLTGLTIKSTGTITATTTGDIVLTLGDTAGTRKLYITDSTGATSTAVFAIDSDGNTFATGTLGIAGTTTLATAGGYVGIGTTTPAYTLSVVGNIYGSGNAIFGGTLSAATSTITGDLLPATTATYNIGSASAKWANIYAATATIGNTLVINTDSITATSSLNLTGAAASTWKTTLGALTIQSADTFTASSTATTTITTAAGPILLLPTTYVGIGTSSPASLLSVYGTSTFMGGYVGIRTTTPAYTLDTYGTFRALSTSTFGGYVGIGTTTPAYTLSVVGNIYGSGNAIFGGTMTVSATSSLATTTIMGGYLGVGTTTPASTLGVYGTSTFMGGNVGIGTTTPTSKLTIHSSTGGSETWNQGILIRNSGSQGEPAIAFNNDQTGANYWITGINQGTDYSFAYGSEFVTATEKLTITASGYVGIGTTGPQQKLTLSSGSNFATEMAVPTGVTTATTTGGTIPAGTYYFKVTATDGVGTTTGSAEVSRTILAGEAIIISWSAVTGASSYQVCGTTTASQNHYFTTTATSYTYSTSTGSTAGAVPTVTTAYVNKLTALGNSWLLGGNVGIGTTTPAYTLDAYGTFRAVSTSTFGGYVGIGTTTPAYTLSVVGNVYGSGNAIFGGTLSVSGTSSLATTTLAGSLLPSTTAIYNIGSSVLKWANIYAATATIGNTLVINTDSITATSSLNLTGAAASTWKTTLGALTIQSADTLTASSTATTTITTTDLVLNLGDAAGTRKFYVKDSAGAVQFALDSDGNAQISGSATTSGAFAVQGSTALATTTISQLTVTTATTTNLYVTGTATSTFAGPLQITSTLTPQLTVRYDASKYLTTSITLTGAATITGSATTTLTTAGNANQLVLAANGNVGIGTTTPAYTLDAYGTFRALSTSTFGGYVGIGTTTPAYTLSVVGNVYGSGNAIFGQNLSVFGTSSFTGTSTFAGRVGIGTTTPSVTFAIAATDAILLPVGTTAQRPTGGTGMLRYNTTLSTFEGFRSGNWTGLGGVIDVDQDTYVIAESAPGADEDVLFFYTAGSERMRIDNVGRVGIGTATPTAERLDIAGGLRLGLAPTTYSTTSEAVSAASTTIPVVSTVGYPSAGTILIDSEAITYATTTATAFGGATRGVLGTATSTHAASTQVKNYIFTAMATSTVPRMVITGDGNVGIGTMTPAALLDVYASSTASALTVAQTMTGNIVDFKSGATSIFTLASADKLKLRDGLAVTFGEFNDVVLDDFEGTFNWTSSDTTYTKVAATTTKIRVNDSSMAITTVVGSSTNDTATTSPSTTNWSTYERLGLWIRADYTTTSTAATTTQIISVRFYDTASGTQTHAVTIKEMSEWQYQEWDISSVASRSNITWVGFRIDYDYGSPRFYIDQIRLYNNDARTSEMFVDNTGSFVVWAQKSVEIGRTSAGEGSLPSIKAGTAVVELNQPLSVNVGGDVGFDYDLVFNNTGLSTISSEGPLQIVAGDPHHYENLTLTTGGTGDIIMNIASSTIGFKIMGSATSSFGAYVLRVTPTGGVEVGGNLNISGNILPSANKTYNLGSASYKWGILYASSTVVGDIIFANQFQITEAMSTSSPQALIFQNASSTPIMTIDENGNLTVTKLIAKEIETERITVRDSEVSKTGITIYDRVSGEPYCIYVELGQMITTSGTCLTATTTSSGGSSSTSTTPETIIDSQPAPSTTATEATLGFHAEKNGATLNGATFQCKLNLLDWEVCLSPKTYTGLIPGNYTFQVFSTDASGNYDASPASFSWQIVENSSSQPATNTAPFVNDLSATTTQNTAINLTLTATDADGDSLTYTVLTQPLIGALSGTAPNLTYTPNATGTDSFTFKASDATADSNTATVTIIIRE